MSMYIQIYIYKYIHIRDTFDFCVMLRTMYNYMSIINMYCTCVYIYIFIYIYIYICVYIYNYSYRHQLNPGSHEAAGWVQAEAETEAWIQAELVYDVACLGSGSSEG